MKSSDKYCGVWPVMLTPMDDQREIDWDALKKLIDWYINAGVSGLFANCKSSEMFFLSDAESLQLTRFVLDYVDGRVPVVASGHIACAMSQQIDQLGRIAETGVDSVILISNRLATERESDDVVLESIKKITAALPSAVKLGIYECPTPYRRLLSDAVVDWCARSGRYTFIKDCSCQIKMIRRRIKLSEGTPLHIANANGQTLLASLQAGGAGYSGVMANIHPELYVWLCDHWQDEPEKAEVVSDYLATASLAEYLDYPICAKDYQVSIGNFRSEKSRMAESNNFYAQHFQTNTQQVVRLGETIKRYLSI